MILQLCTEITSPDRSALVVVMVMMVVPWAEHPGATIPNIAMLEIPAAVMMVMVVVMMVDGSTWIILGFEKLSRRTLAFSIVGTKPAHGIRNRLQQVGVGGGSRNRLS